MVSGEPKRRQVEDDGGRSARVNLAIMGKVTRDDFAARRAGDPTRSALIIVDMQYYSACRTMGLGKKFTDEGQADCVAWRFDRLERLVVPNLQRLLAFFRDHRLPVIYVTLGSRAEDFSDASRHMRALFETYNGRAGMPEARILEEIAPRPGEFVFNKTTVGAFASTNLDAHLRHYRIQRLFFAGVSTSACVGHTACFAADLEYDCTVVEDACADLRPEDHAWFLEHFQRFFGRVAATEAVMTELSRELRSLRA